jgi:glutaredoxin
MTPHTNCEWCAAVREILTKNDVPVAAFIDDHLKNALIQRNEARARVKELEAMLEGKQ